MDYTTSISKNTEDDTLIRGVPLSSLESFPAAIFLLLAKRVPDETERQVFEHILTQCIDHGMGTSSAMSARYVASTGNQLNAAGAAGLLGLGQRHGGAISSAMEQFSAIAAMNGDTVSENAAAFVSDRLSSKELLYGFGHRQHRIEDPRTTRLLALAEKLGLASEYITIAQECERALEEQKGKRLVLNIDGAIAAVLLALDFPISAGNAVFYIARLPGLLAHAIEEQEGQPVRRVPDSDINYTGE